MLKLLDPLLHSQLRLSVMTLLVSVKEAEFSFIKEKINVTSGNLSVQLQKLSEAGYIQIKKRFKNNYPLTTCKITDKGIKAFEQYIEDLKEYFAAAKTTS
ncbi:MAG: transcriptional regulator [Candidatus Nephrothrix sp. EaCA]|nr:MAG: transcriptional regulator [Candidatus Nephrothrix sp. EaCA]